MYIFIYCSSEFIPELERGAQQLTGRVIASRPRGRGFDIHRRHCLVSLSKTYLSLLSTVSTHEDPSRHNWKNVDWDVNNQSNKTKEFEQKTS